MSDRFRSGLPAVCAALAFAAPAAAGEPAPGQQALDDAWWTGPMLASGAGTLPHGHLLVEPYLFDVRAKGGDTLGSLTYVLYGLTDDVTIGAIPTFYYNRPDGAPNSSRVRAGDLTLSVQKRLTKYRPGSWVPTTSIVVQETLPNARFDRLDGRAADGVGAGAYATFVAFYAQTYAWAPNGRIVRLRLNSGATYSRAMNVEGESVYGTPAGFRGRAKPGTSYMTDLALEYSATQNWVLAMDLLLRHDESTKVEGVGADGRLVSLRSGDHDSIALAPAVEYNFNSRVGVLVGMRVIPRSDGRASSVTPAVALNMVY
jgi:hypothetical protein